MIFDNLFNLVCCWFQITKLILDLAQLIIIIMFRSGTAFLQLISVGLERLSTFDSSQVTVFAAATTVSNSVTDTIFSGGNVVNFVLLGVLGYIVIMLSNLGKKHKELSEELGSLKGGLEKIEKKVSDADGKRQDSSGRNRGQVKVSSEQSTWQPATSRYHNKNSPISRKDEVDSLANVSQFQTAPTVLSSTYIVEHSKEQKQLEEMLFAYRAIFDNLHIEDIRDFCKHYKVVSAKRHDSVNTETALELADDLLIGDSNLWAVPYIGDAYHIVPGTVIRTSFKNLNSENSRTIGEIFKGVMLITPNNKFELVEPAVAEKRSGVLVVTKQGKLGVPFGNNKR